MSFNIQKSEAQHGGNLSQLAAQFPDASRPFIDLSTGINPYPYPLVVDTNSYNRLADNAEMLAAITAAANYYGVSPETTHLAAGMQPLMFAVAAARFQKFGAAKVAVLSPTYSEYAKIWQAAGHEVTLVQQPDFTGFDVAIICNPNNPDGFIITKAKLLAFANELAAKNGWLLIDEAFADTCPENSVADEVADKENLVVFRSVGKFFGLAGLRVSVAIAPASWEVWLQMVLGDWPITTPACLALPSIFSDTKWMAETNSLLQQESEKWREILGQHFTIIGHTPLFTLVETENPEQDADFWYKKLGAAGIMVRRFSYNPRWLRFGLPKEGDMARIITAMES